MNGEVCHSHPSTQKTSYFHCLQCKRLLTTPHSLRKHKKNVNVHDICGEVNHDHVLINESFEDLNAAKAWVISKELDKTFHIAASRQNYVLYRCRLRRSRSESKPRNPDPAKRRMGVAKPTFPCSAQLAIDMVKLCHCDSNVDGSECLQFRDTFRLRGCLTHCHKVEPHFQKLSTIQKDALVSLLKQGVPKRTILKQFCSSYSNKDSPSKLITIKDLENLERLHGSCRGKKVTDASRMVNDSKTDCGHLDTNSGDDSFEDRERRQMHVLSVLYHCQSFLETNRPWREKRAMIEKIEDFAKELSFPSVDGLLNSNGDASMDSLQC